MEPDRIKERIRVLNKWRLCCKSQTFPCGIPESWGDTQLFQYDPATGKHICRLCSWNGKTKYADDSHVASRGHQIWVPYAAGFIPGFDGLDAGGCQTLSPPPAMERSAFQLVQASAAKDRLGFLNKCNETSPFGIPESWGDSQLFQYDPATGKHICRLCSQNGKTKYADDSHVASRGHQIWVPSSNGKHRPINGPTVVVVG